MVIPGKPNLELRLLTQDDRPALEKFFAACESLGLENNKSADAIKLDKMHMPYGQYFIGWDYNKNCIWNLAGIHHLPELGSNKWRVLFRGAQLPGYALGVGKDFLRVSYHWRYFLPMQINFIKENYPDAEFVISTNIKNASAGKSDQLNKKLMPLLVNRGIVSLYKENVELFYTKQNVWLINETNLTQALIQH
jgi:hypothetical protein